MRRSVLPVLVFGALTGAFVAAGLTALSLSGAVGGTGTQAGAGLGLPDPGALTTYGLPVVRTLTEIAAVLTVGGLLLCAVLAPPADPARGVDAAGLRTLRWTSHAAACWAVGAVLLVPLTVADSLGLPVTRVLGFAELTSLVPRLDTAGAWATTALLALVVLAGTRVTLSWGGTLSLLGLALLALVPVGATGHSSAGGSHDLATDSLVLHLVAAALWVGGLVALLGPAARRETLRLAVAVRRFSALALGCWLVMAVSGILNALVRVDPGQLLTSYYGALLLAKTACLLGLGALGQAQRRAAVGRAVRGDGAALLRLGAVEVLLMLATIGLAVALGHTAPPVSAAPEVPAATELTLGYDLPAPPDAAALLLDWRVDLVLTALACAAAGWYLRRVARLDGSGPRWPHARTGCWLAGCLLLVLAGSSGLGRYAPALLSALLVQWALLAVPVPLLLVLGAPLTLARRPLAGLRAAAVLRTDAALTTDAGPGASAGPEGDAGPGPDAVLGADAVPAGGARLLAAAVGSPLVRALTRPVPAVLLAALCWWPLLSGGLLAGLLGSRAELTLARLAVVAAGLPLFWLVLGHPPRPEQEQPRSLGHPPRPLGLTARLAVLAGAAVSQLAFAALLYSGDEPLARPFYLTLGLHWPVDLIGQQRLGAVLATLLVLAGLFTAALVLLARRSRPAAGGSDGAELPAPAGVLPRAGY
jgi:cytochrome c oxidase assembly factor CtaG/putative copper export protein